MKLKTLLLSVAIAVSTATPAIANGYRFRDFNAETQASLMGIVCNHARLVIKGEQTSLEATTRARVDTLLFLARRYPKFRRLNQDQMTRIVIALTEESTKTAVNFRCQGM